MRIAFLTSSVSRLGGGLFTSVRRLGQSLVEAEEGLSVSVLSTVDEFVEADLPQWAPLEVSAYSYVGPWGFRFTPRILTRLKAEAFDLLHVHHIWMYPSVAALNWNRATTRPYIVSPRGMMDLWAQKQSRLKKWFAWILFERAHLWGAACIHALGESEVVGIRAAGIRAPVCLIPNGVDVPTIVTSSVVTSGMPRQLLFLGRLHPKKGLGELLQAWARWKSSEPSTAAEWKLTVAGWGEREHVRRFLDMVTYLGISSSVSFVGPVYGEGKARLLNECTAFILPSFSEGAPIAVLEAWAYGRPVIISPQCNFPRGFMNSAAISVEPSQQGILAGLNRLGRLSSLELCAMGEHGRQLVTRDYCWSTIANQMKDVYRWVLGGGDRPSTVLLA